MHLLDFKNGENKNKTSWHGTKRGIAIPLMDQNERTAGTGIFWPSQSQAFSVNENVNFLFHYVQNMLHIVGSRFIKH